MTVFRNLMLAITLLVSVVVVLAVGFPETPLGDRLLSVLTRETRERGSADAGYYQYVDSTGAMRIVDDLSAVPPDQRANVQRVKARGKKLQQFSRPDPEPL